MEDCQVLWDQAIAYCTRKTGHVEGETLRRIQRSEQARQAIAAVDAAMRTSDAVACRLACRAYCEAILTGIHQWEHAREHA